LCSLGKSEITNSKFQFSKQVLGFGFGILVLFWNLDFGFWNFDTLAFWYFPLFGILVLWHFGIFHYLVFWYFGILAFSTILDLEFWIWNLSICGLPNS